VDGTLTAMLPACATLGLWILEPANWLVILQVALGLGFVIFVHELGHFLVAKACGVKCEKFYIGFDVGGAKLLSFQWGETEYGIGALPLGGYVKMLGQDDNPAAAAREAQRAKALIESGDLPAEPTSDPHPAWDPRSYPAQSVPERMAIISAGVIMNVIFAVLLAAWAFGLGVEELTCEVSSVRPGGAAWRAGLRTGDEIIAIGGKADPVFTDLQKGVTLGDPERGVDFTVFRPAAGSERTLTLYPDTDLGIPTVGVTSPFSTTLPDDLEPGLPGAAGQATPAFQPGDTISAVDGEPVATYADLIKALAVQAEAVVMLSVQRGEGGQVVAVELPPQPRRETGLLMAAGPIASVQADSPAARAGIRPGDRLVSLDGAPVGDPLSLDARLRERAGSPVQLSLIRADAGRDEAGAAAIETIELTPRPVTWIEESRWPQSPVALSSLGIAFTVESRVLAVADDSPAARAGIQPGETVTRARFVKAGDKAGPNDQGVELSPESPSWPFVMAMLQQSPADTRLSLTVAAADGLARDVELAPVADDTAFVVDRGLVFKPVYRLVQAGSVGAALSKGLAKTGEDLSVVYRFLQKVTSNQISPRLLGGPIEIAKQAGKSAQEGLGRLLLFLTMLSANLAVINFLPIPVLDGGHMVFLFYELVRGKPPSEKVVEGLSYLGLLLLLSLMLFVFGLDLGLIPRR
jgi:regulator of sigma E protease